MKRQTKAAEHNNENVATRVVGGSKQGHNSTFAYRKRVYKLKETSAWMINYNIALFYIWT